ncbi:DUF86 domain-containing protein [Rhizobium sp. KVB221]|uniref:DUF86 domain-containing protein n=1 Tax=Rhizobium setariae TaxID=2801340 RepID=A0A937CKS9_9HYPH|nr:HepT-like ribonuclease domain-containing protein [Rhizobium setariae]MBL0370806.1 DUF86 domain-containing protein [Rhizobium setariae]
MIARRPDAVIQEMSDAIAGILAATDGKTFADYQGNWLLQRATERALEIISEASRHLPDALLAQAREIPWKQIRGIGNILRHQYHSVADEIIWAVITEHIRPLKLAMERIKSQTA